ncbi:SDR family oxidoreductase [Labrys sp. KB_33_2]|uniref:SDR family oxidoreductase n=1 Tax=Labrys sp. KB_33_2 TaxID=3237479 RepID=UPI003F8DFBEE
MNEFAGKVVLVTGGAKGVGKILAKRFAALGAHVVVNYFHSLDEAKKTAAEIETSGGKVRLIRASVARQDQVDRLFDEVEREFGKLDILINNAASGVLLPMEQITDDHFDKALNTNLKGAFWCARRAAPLMERAGGGSIVNLSSIGAGKVPAHYLVVGTSKAALESLTRYLAVELGPRNIRVNTASTTLIDGATADLFPDAAGMKTSHIQASVLKRLATAEDMAAIVEFLASERSGLITGQMILADGGVSLCSEGLSSRPQPASEGEPWGAPALDVSASIAVTVEQPAAAMEEDEIAIVGMGLALPGANDADDFWRILNEGTELFSIVPSDRWDYRSFYNPDPGTRDKSYQANSVFITDFKAHPRLQAEIDAGQAPAEYTTLWLRHALMQALDEVTLRPDARTSFFVGYTADGSQHLEEAMVLAGLRNRLGEVVADQANDLEAAAVSQDIDTVLSKRYHRGAAGFAEFYPHKVGTEAMRGVLPVQTDYMMVDTACSSSLYAVDIGMKALLLGEKDVAICGGAFALAPRGKVLFSKLHGLSKSGQVRPLDKNSDGVLFADGAGVVVLKRLKQALSDGDKILGLVKAFGSSSDGKGKAIYAPSAEGQNIAIRRAYDEKGPAIGAVDWVVAHATGTPAGDLAEFQSLRSMFSGDRPVQVTSNKSLVGHTGWAAGVTSLIQVLLSLRHGVITPQHRFSAPPEQFESETSNLRIPEQAVPWPADAQRQRLAAISGFGFGGTNGHLVVADYIPGKTGSLRLAAPSLADEPLVIVGWSAKLPGLEKEDDVRRWLLGHGSGPQASFGNAYPLPPFGRVKMPPAVLKILDRCQLMALDAAHELRSGLTDFWDKEAGRIGVIVGHMGATRNAALYASRCYLDDMALAISQAIPGAKAQAFMGELRRKVEGLIPPTSENAFPGMMPNVIPARVANYFDLHGLNMTIDAGYSSTLAAFKVAASYLCSGELSMAIVGGVNGNSAAEIVPSLKARPAEAIVLFAVTTLAQAKTAGLEILARIGTGTQAMSAASGLPFKDETDNDLTYLGADGALAILRSIVEGRNIVIGARDAGDQAPFSVHIQPAGAAARPSESVSAERPALPAGLSRTERSVEDNEPLELTRYRIDFVPTPWQRSGEAIPFLLPRTAVVTDMPELLDDLVPLPADLTVLSLAPLPEARAGWHHISVVADGCLDGLLNPAVSHIRILSNLQASAPAPELASEVILKLHSLSFLALKRFYDQLGKHGSFLALLLDGVVAGGLHPNAGVLTGLVKSMAIEVPTCRSLAIFTNSPRAREGVWQAERETSASHVLPVVVLEGESRLLERVCPAAGRMPLDGRMPLGPESVVVAIGGARGITAETLKGLAKLSRPRIYVIASSDIGDGSPLMTASDDDFKGMRPDFVRRRKAEDPGLAVAAINREYERIAAQREARGNLEALKQACGADRVHYLRASVLNAERLQSVVADIYAREARVDLVISAAGMGRGAAIPAKALSEFEAIRDLKVRGFWNLRKAFDARRVGAWCNFGSLMGLTGQAGETDYSSGNDMLNTQAAYLRRRNDLDMFSIGWTLWAATGMGKNSVTAAFFERVQTYTSTRIGEGVHHFLREICSTDRGSASVLLGDKERRAITDIIPGFFAPVAVTTSSTVPMQEAVPLAPLEPQLAFYLDKCLEKSVDEVVFERTFDLTRDPYLDHHLVNGFATLPGTFVTEIGAEAALQLSPGAVVVGFEDIVFHNFLRAYGENRPSTKRIRAKVISRDGDKAAIQVHITGDIIAPNGQILQKDKLHFELKVLTAANYPPMLYWPKWPEQPFTPVADPYHMEGAPVRLTEMFVSTTDTRATPLGKYGRFKLALGRSDAVFSHFAIPTILLDGLARIGVLNHVARDYIPLAAPTSIRRIDIYEGGNDIELAARHDEIELYVSPREYTLGGGSTNRFVATRRDRGMLLQMRDVGGVVTGYVHRSTGVFATVNDVEAILASLVKEGAAA